MQKRKKAISKTRKTISEVEQESIEVTFEQFRNCRVHSSIEIQLIFLRYLLLPLSSQIQHEIFEYDIPIKTGFIKG